MKFECGLPTLATIGALASLVTACTVKSEKTAVAPPVTVLEIMETVITPATDTLWGVGEPTSDEEWKTLEAAAIATIEAGAMIRRGGAGPNDDDWAAEPAWQAFVDVMTAAGNASLDAIRKKDLDALMAAADILYPPCEDCHHQYNPGVVGQPSPD